MKSLLRLKPYLLRHKKILILGILTVVGSNLFSVVQPLLLGYAVDELKAGIETSTYITDNLMMWALYIVGFSLVAGFFTYLTRQTLIVTSRHIEYDLRNDFLAHLQKLHYPYFQNTPTGDLMAHATNDIAAVRNVLGPGIMYPSDTLMTFTMVLTMMLVTDWRLTLLALVPLPLVSLVVYRISKSVHEKFNERQEQFSKLTTKAQENLSGIRVIKAYVRELFEIEDFRTISWDYLKKNLVLARVQSIMWPLMFVLVGFSILMVLYFGGVRVIDGAITIGTLTAFFGYLVMLIWPMIAFGWVANLMQQGAASMARLAKIFDTVPEIRDTEATDQSITNIRGEIEFRNVTFTHKNAEKPTLKNINLKIDNGMTLAVIGYTGAGKTTLINLITRLYEASEGEVLVDGAPVRNIPVAILRSHIGYVPQETFLFSDTIAENIRYGVDNHHSEEHLRDAAEIAQISKDVIEFPKQFETMIGERGITLSGGQNSERASPVH